MNVLIFTGAFGMGHYSAAKAVKEEILKERPDANIQIVDLLEYLLPNLSKVVYGSFNFLVSKFSSVYNFFNEIVAKKTSVPLKKSVIKRMDLLLNDNNIDFVVSTFPACTQYFSAYKKLKNCNIPLYTYITDISVNEEWISKETNMYFVGSDITKKLLEDKNVDSEKIIVSGIPIRQSFKENDIIEEVKNKKEILIMGGGLGLVPCSGDLLKKLSYNENIKITFIAGKNEKLLERIKGECPNIEAIGYTDKIDEYMKKSDLIITKSGGVTLFEAMYSETPLYIIKPFLYQEIGNATFVQEKGMGKVIWTHAIDICEDITSLIENELLLDSMKKNIKKEKEKLQNVSPLDCYYGGMEICY